MSMLNLFFPLRPHRPVFECFVEGNFIEECLLKLCRHGNGYKDEQNECERLHVLWFKVGRRLVDLPGIDWEIPVEDGILTLEQIPSGIGQSLFVKRNNS